MKRHMFLTAFVLMILAVALNGCCNRCKNKPDGYVPTAAAGQGAYAGGSQDQAVSYSRQATK